MNSEYGSEQHNSSLDALKQRASPTMPTFTSQQANILSTPCRFRPWSGWNKSCELPGPSRRASEGIWIPATAKGGLEPLATADLLARWLNQTKDLHQGMCQNLEKVQRGIQEENRQAGKQRDEFMRAASTVIERLRRDGEELQKSFRRWAATTIMCSVAGATAASILVWRILG